MWKRVRKQQKVCICKFIWNRTLFACIKYSCYNYADGLSFGSNFLAGSETMDFIIGRVDLFVILTESVKDAFSITRTAVSSDLF